MQTESALPSFVQSLGDGVHAIDTGFHRTEFDAAYLLVQEGRAAFIDTGTHLAAPRLLQALDALGLARDAVDWVIPTHVHLDHAGGVGTLMRALPAARALVHPRGTRHMIDPQALWQGATAVYGAEEMARSYGEVVPVEAARVVESFDDMVVFLADRPLRLIDSPGHARHHHCIWDATTRGWFTGDTFGISYREFDGPAGAWIFPSSTPVQFDPAALSATLKRLLAADPACMYLTHYGRVQDVSRLAHIFEGLLAQMVSLGGSVAAQPDRHDRHTALKAGLHSIYLDSLRAAGSPVTPEQATELLALDVELNAQGMAVWLDRAN
jgi:glyoxylase-like metal-dependent hydrolase (beta-lactamase superfamily II)